MNRLLAIIIVVLIITAGALRLAGIYHDFWLDEIWSWRIASQLPHYHQILTSSVARFDNNHPLNTFFMCLIGHHPNWPIYRVPALAAGIGSVIVAYITLRRRGRTEAFVGLLLIGFSYPLILYSSEARGYALAVFFSLLAFDAMDRFLRSRGWLANIVFVVASVLGFLSHLTFVHFYAGVLVWSVMRWVREGHAGMNALRFHLIPPLSAAGLWFIFVRYLTIGGSPSEQRLQAVLIAIGDLLGAGGSTAAAVVLVAIAAGLFGWSLLWLWRWRDDLWILLLICVIVSPVLVVAGQWSVVEQAQPIHARYFLVPYLFLLIGIGLLMSDWLRRRDALRIAAVGILGAFLVVNLTETRQFLRYGRGHYQQVLLEMAQRSPGAIITVSSDHPLRTGWVLDFYKIFLPPQQQLVIYDDSDVRHLAPRTHGLPMWVIVHSPLRGQPPAQSFVLDGNRYLLVREFPYYGLSGYSWYLYRHTSIP